MGYAISHITVAALKHLSIHGVCSLTKMKAALPALQAKTMNNLVQLAHILRTEAGYSITPKGRAKLKATEEETPESHTMMAAASPRLVAQPASSSATPAMLSNAEAEATITAVLKRARVRQSLQDIARRSHLPEHIVRPTLSTMVLQSKVDGSKTKPIMYRLVKQWKIERNTHLCGGPREHLTSHDYTCPELARNPGIGADRFAAFDLPSRINDRLHWPDGRVTSVHDPR